MSILFYIQLVMLLLNPSDRAKSYMMKEVNTLRAEGCKCGNEWMEPVAPLQWNNTLYKSARSHARQMKQYNFFSHYGRRGENIAERIESFGYNWQVVGENIGKGQTNFKQVFQDWIDSETHCKMLMNANVEDMAVARVGRYWVQHFGRERE